MQQIYGQLKGGAYREVGAIFRSRNLEPDLCEPFGFAYEFMSDPEHDIELDYAKRVWILLETLTEREKKVIQLRFEHDLTLDECGEVFEISKERVRQIEKNAIRKLLMPSRIGSLGIVPDRWAGLLKDTPHLRYSYEH